MKFLIPATAALCGLALTHNTLHDYGSGNHGSGHGNAWIGTDNLWLGNQNTILGNENTLLGNHNEVTGNENRVEGSGNVVRGSGNIIEGVESLVGGLLESAIGGGEGVGPKGASIRLEITNVKPDFVEDENGNVGLGIGNYWNGRDNTWLGNRNSIEGDVNGVYGDKNSIRGNTNYVSGSGNKVTGQDNVVRGSGNIVSSGGSSELEAEILKRFPAWMRNGGSPFDAPEQPSRSPKNIQSDLAKQINAELQARFPAWMRSSNKGGSVSPNKRVSPRKKSWFPPMTFEISGNGKINQGFEVRPRISPVRKPFWGQGQEDDCEGPYSHWPGRKCKKSQWPNKDWASSLRNSLKDRIKRDLSREFIGFA